MRVCTHFCEILYIQYIYKNIYFIYFVCKYSEEDCSSQGELTDVIKYAALCRITRFASFRPREFTLPSLTREVRTTEDASPKFA